MLNAIGGILLTQDQCDPTNPEQAFAWCFAAGVPDPRNTTQPGKNYRNQPFIPPLSFGALSQMLWDFGLTFDPSKQTKWIVPSSGPARNFATWSITDTKPTSPVTAPVGDLKAAAAAVVVDQFPEVAAKITAVTPATHKAALAAQANELLGSLARLQAARERHGAQQAEAKEGGAAK